MARVVVLGLGSTMRRDDAVGLVLLESVRAVRQWPGDVEFVWAADAPLRCLERLRGASSCLVIDAMDAPGRSPGEVVVTPFAEVAPEPGGNLHAPSLRHALALLSEAQRPEAWIVGIQAADLGRGEGLSGPVAATLAAAQARITAEIDALRARWSGARTGAP